MIDIMAGKETTGFSRCCYACLEIKLSALKADSVLLLQKSRIFSALSLKLDFHRPSVVLCRPPPNELRF